MAFPRLLSLSPQAVGLGYLLAYITLDWISFVHPLGPFGITPWNPSTGLSFVLILLFGLRHLPLLFLAPPVADLLVRGLPAGLVGVLSGLAIGAGYSVAALILLRPLPRFDVSLSSTWDLFLLLLVAAVSSAAVAVAYVVIHILGGFLPWSDIGVATLRFWIGDLIGIAVATPFLLILLTRGSPFNIGLEATLQVLLLLVCLVLAFGTPHGRQLQLFYLLFLPIVWIAIRSGLEGVTAGLVLTQLGLIAALQLQLQPPSAIDVTAFQALMLILSLTGLAAGVLVTERRRAELQLRLQQDTQARLTRLGSMGELASALAHEINQPLMAAGTYARLVTEAVAAGGPSERIGDAANKAAQQVERAAEVVRRLRDLIRLGRSELAPAGVARIVDEAVELIQPDIDRAGIRIERQLPGNLPPVMVDALQVEQVLLNLIRNAIEAIRETGRERGLVTIEARRNGDTIELSVADDGPGFVKLDDSADPVPLSSTKPEGLGIGLSLCRSIIQAHGGMLKLANTGSGALVRFTLPIVESGR